MNLLRNPGAEEGSIGGWYQNGSSSVIADSNGAFNSGYFPRTGTYCFAGGRGEKGSPSRLIQNVNLLGGVQGFTESQLDAGSLRVELIFYYQTYNPWIDYDQVEVSLTFRSGSSSILQTKTSGEKACEKDPGWCDYMEDFPLPNGTRSIDYTMTFTQKNIFGDGIDSYTDDNSLRVI